eukprot:m.90935 g.90935  ORF g.90935 m.90935 type:complete len:338 (+) comp51109_c0_seq1:100-1113(+)
MLVIALVIAAVGSVLADPPLGKYNVDGSLISVSGISAGAYEAVQFHVAFSANIMGASIFAGGPFWCAEDDVDIALSSCMDHPELISVDELVAATNDAADTGTVDSPSHLHESRAFLYSGTLDTVVVPGVVQKLEAYYASYIDSSQIKTVFNVSAEHSMPTASFGNNCSYLGTPYINNCGYDGAYDALNHTYGNIERASPSAAIEANLLTFDQNEFFGDASLFSMNGYGYIYVPNACASSSTKCRLHISFHGCLQDVSFIQNTYALHAGYNAHAEVNDIIVLYPQAATLPELNPNGCFDWWGYTGPDYATKIGAQSAGVARMVSRISAGQFPAPPMGN